MTDLLYMPILILLSWLIRQIENGIGGSGNEPDEQEDDDENETGSEQQAGEGERGEEGGQLGIEQAGNQDSNCSIFALATCSVCLCIPEDSS